MWSFWVKSTMARKARWIWLGNWNAWSGPVGITLTPSFSPFWQWWTMSWMDCRSLWSWTSLFWLESGQSQRGYSAKPFLCETHLADFTAFLLVTEALPLMGLEGWEQRLDSGQVGAADSCCRHADHQEQRQLISWSNWTVSGQVLCMTMTLI